MEQPTLTPTERAIAMFELSECERRADQLKVRVGEIEPPPGAEDRAAQMMIPEAERPRAEARIDALEHRCQELLEQLWPIGDRGL